MGELEVKEVKIWSKVFIGLGVILIILDIILGMDFIIDNLRVNYETIEALKISMKLIALLAILMSFVMKSFYKALEYKENKINSSEKRIKSLEDKIDKLIKK